MKDQEDNMDRPVTTLFMLMSVDGKISTGATDDLDVDKDFPKIAGLNEGLHQYYDVQFRAGSSQDRCQYKGNAE